MQAGDRVISRDKILSMTDYGAQRAELRRQMIAVKRDRRIDIGPFVSLYFESYQTMWYQVHEMLFTERGGEEQIDDELAAYNPLIPQGDELVATMMLEIENPTRRKALLAKLGGIEETVRFAVAGQTVAGVPEDDVERTTAEGKTSSVHFLHFRFSPQAIAAFRSGDGDVTLAIDHPDYRHAATLSDAARAALAGDFA